MPVYPEMIMFDYGRTLLYEPGYSTLNGERALFEYVTENPRGVTPEEADAFARELFAELDAARQDGFEVQEYPILRCKNEFLGLKYSISLEEAETVLWNGISPGAVMPGAAEMLDYLNSRGIRTAVISNVAFSGRALRERLDRLLPNNRFEFVIASSDYAFRKPGTRLFELALRKAELSADRVWYCGDRVRYDIAGAAGAGIFPVWYEGSAKGLGSVGAQEAPRCGHLHITEWSEMINFLEKLPK